MTAVNVSSRFDRDRPQPLRYSRFTAPAQLSPSILATASGTRQVVSERLPRLAGHTTELLLVDNAGVSRKRVSDGVSVSYVSPGSVHALLKQGRRRMVARLRSADMISVAEAASLLGEDERAVLRWIKQERCLALSLQGHETRLPDWQFVGDLLLWIGPVREALEAINGWQVLSFLETPHDGLDGRTPRVALEQGDVERVLAIAST